MIVPRVLHEALTARADPLHLALAFGLSHTTASRIGRLHQRVVVLG